MPKPPSSSATTSRSSDPSPLDPSLLDLIGLQRILRDWYARNARDLPWRRPRVSGWEVLVSEVMLHQTPVARVLPVYSQWLERWPHPADLAAEPVSEAIRAWGRLGYPRRALRLHEAACVLVQQHDGVIPRDYANVRALPGVGDYTTSAVLSFAYRQRHPVLDTNVRRVFARVVGGIARPTTSSPTTAEITRATALLPDDPEQAAQWATATMEFGALVCTSRSPQCENCPLTTHCQWRKNGYPVSEIVTRRQTYEGTDRQVRGLILAALRQHHAELPSTELAHLCPDAEQFRRALASLLHDGLLSPGPTPATVQLP